MYNYSRRQFIRTIGLATAGAVLASPAAHPRAKVFADFREMFDKLGKEFAAAVLLKRKLTSNNYQ